ncbi:MAG: DUF1080 domain-containing protein [Verrucomicrobiota bacterium]
MNSSLARRDFLKTAATAPFMAAVARAGEPETGAPIFDGKTLEGWHTIPRLYVPRDGRLDHVPSGELKEAVTRFHAESAQENLRAKAANHGIWTVEDGAIVGKQLPDSKDGSYLMSDGTYGDFDLTLEARPDWPIDTGVMVRAHSLGTVGFQVLLDTRPEGCIGGVFGNGIGSFRAMPYLVEGDEQENFQVSNLRQSTVDRGQFIPEDSASFEEFLAAWKLNEWNTVRIRCRGELPVIETWINGTPIVKFDSSTLANQIDNWQPEVVKERLGQKGHIAFEVHDSWNSRERWAPGAACRWRNVRITEL